MSAVVEVLHLWALGMFLTVALAILAGPAEVSRDLRWAAVLLPAVLVTVAAVERRWDGVVIWLVSAGVQAWQLGRSYEVELHRRR